MDKTKIVHEFLTPYFIRHLKMECSCSKFDKPCLLKKFIDCKIGREEVYEMAMKERRKGNK